MKYKMTAEQLDDIVKYLKERYNIPESETDLFNNLLSILDE